MNYRFIFYSICLHTAFFLSSKSIKEEFKQYIQNSEFDNYFKLTIDERNTLIEQARIAKFESLMIATKKTVAEPFKGKLIEMLKKLILLEEKKYWGIQEAEILKIKKTFLAASNCNHDESKRILNILNRIEKQYAKNMTGNIFNSPFALTGGALEVSKKEFPNLYAFISSICKANNIDTPKLYTGKSGMLKTFGLAGSTSKKTNINDAIPSIYIDSEFFEILDEKELKAILAHELGHFYYGDSKRYLKLRNQELLSKIYHLREFRADLFAAQYGYAQSFASGERKIISEVLKRKPYLAEQIKNNKTHPCPEKRIAASLKLPSLPSTTVLDPCFQNNEVTFVPRRQPAYLIAPKIVNSSVQAHRTAQILIQASQAAKRLPK